VTTKQEEIEQELEEYFKRETSFAIHGCLRWIAVIVILIAAIFLGT
jgi:hypothetical protein